MAQTLREADEIEAARVASGKLVFVGYMRRFATAFLRVKKLVQELDPAEINYGEFVHVNSANWSVRIRNFTSRVNILLRESSQLERTADYP
jgi:predicted dehydrogenase